MNEHVKGILDDIRMFMELSDEVYDLDEVHRILELAHAGCTPEMMAEDMDIPLEKITLYVMIMCSKKLMAPLD